MVNNPKPKPTPNQNNKKDSDNKRPNNNQIIIGHGPRYQPRRGYPGPETDQRRRPSYSQPVP